MFLMLGYVTGGPVFFIAFALSLALLIGDYIRLRLMGASVRKIWVLRSLSRNKLNQGMATTLTSRLKYHGAGRLSLWVSQSLDPSIIPDTGNSRLTFEPGSIVTLRSNLTVSARGVFTIRPLNALIESWLFKDTIPLVNPETLSIVVGLETTSTRPSTALRGKSQYSDIFENISERLGGSDFSGVRCYIAGDNVKNIDWAISSRAGSLIIRQYEEVHTTPVYFLIDVDSSMGVGEKSELESAVGLVALLTDRLRIDNESIGLACFSRTDITSYLRIGMGRDHVAIIKNILSTVEPVGSSNTGPDRSVSVQELRQVGRVFGKDLVLDAIISETLKGYMANVRHDGFSQSVLKVAQSTSMPCHLVVITNLSMGMTSMLNGIRLASYYGHSVSVVLTPHIWHEDKELIDIGRYYEEYTVLKDTIRKLRGNSVKVIDLSAMERAEDIIYSSRIKNRLTGIRG